MVLDDLLRGKSLGGAGIRKSMTSRTSKEMTSSVPAFSASVFRTLFGGR